MPLRAKRVSSAQDKPSFERSENVDFKCFRYATLMLCFLMNFFTVADKGLLSVLLPNIEETFDIGHLEAGFISTAYTIGHSFAALSFGLLFNHCPPMILLACGVTGWVGCVVANAMAPSYYSLLISRGITGVLEGAVIVVLPAVLNKIAPNGKQTRWLGFFFISNAVGVSYGQFFGGLWLENFPNDFYGLNNWRTAYLANGACQIPLILVCFICCGFENFSRLDGDSVEGNSLSGIVFLFII